MNQSDFLVCGLFLGAQLVKTGGGVVDEGCEHISFRHTFLLLQAEGVQFHSTYMIAMRPLRLSLQDGWIETSSEISVDRLHRA